MVVQTGRRRRDPLEASHRGAPMSAERVCDLPDCRQMLEPPAAAPALPAMGRQQVTRLCERAAEGMGLIARGLWADPVRSAG
jgi:DNA-binding GntR family transcriptional regulator